MAVPTREIRDSNGVVKAIAFGTPNSMAMQYVMRSKSINNRTLVFKSLEQAQSASPHLVTFLMKEFPDISRVALGSNPQGYDYMTVTVRAPGAWKKDGMQEKAEALITRLVDHINNHPIEKLVDFAQFPKAKSAGEYRQAFERAGCSFWQAQHRAVIAIVSNDLAHDGGEVHFAGYDDKSQTLQVWLEGNCHGCAGSAMTVQLKLMRIFKETRDQFEKPVSSLQIVEARPKIVAPIFS